MNHRWRTLFFYHFHSHSVIYEPFSSLFFLSESSMDWIPYYKTFFPNKLRLCKWNSCKQESLTTEGLCYNPIMLVDCKGGWNRIRVHIWHRQHLLCSRSLAMMCWLWSAACASFATCVLAFSKFSATVKVELDQVYNSCSTLIMFYQPIPLRSLLKSCSLLTSATSLLLSVCSRFSLFVLPFISVS